MRKIIAVMFIFGILFTSKIANAATTIKFNQNTKIVYKPISIKRLYETTYMWIFYGDCIQLVGIISNNGIPYDAFLCDASNYAGTTSYCPPAGSAYC